MSKGLDQETEQFGIVPARGLNGTLGSVEFAVYAALCVYADEDGWAWPSELTISGGLKLHVKTVRRTLYLLQEKGFIRIVRPDRNGRGKFNRYCIVDKSKRKGTLDTPFPKERGQKGDFRFQERGLQDPMNNTKNIEQRDKLSTKDERCGYHGLFNCKTCYEIL